MAVDSAQSGGVAMGIQDGELLTDGPLPGRRRPADFHLTEPRQERIYQGLRSIGPGPAAFYMDACRLIATEPPLESTTHLVAHLLREIEGWICEVLETPEDRALRKIGGRTWFGRAIRKLRIRLMTALGGKPDAPGQHQLKIKNILRHLNIPEKDAIARRWLNLAGTLAGRAHRGALQSARAVDKGFLRVWDDMQVVLDEVLARYRARYLDYHQRLETLLKIQKPRRADVKVLQHTIPNNYTAMSDFFDRLSSPAWLGPLRKRGLFAHPPGPQRREDHTHGTLVSHPSWPQARYLIRMATLDPKTVRGVIMSVAETENDRVHEELTRAACALPPALAVDWARRGTAWVPSRPYLYSNLPTALGELVVHLARGEQGTVALELSAALFSVLPEERKTPADEGAKLFWHSEPHPRFGVWIYKEQLERCLPPLTEAVGLRALALGCSLLEDAIRLSRQPGEEDPELDFSYSWHKGIEWGASHNLKGMLVCAVRDTAERLIKTEGKLVLDAVEGRRYRVFGRIGLHLRRKWPSVDPNGTAEKLSDPAVLNDMHYQHERYHLLKAQFAHLPEKARQAYLEWVGEGPDVQEWLMWHEREDGTRPTPEEGQQYARRWQYERLLPVQDALPSEWARTFEELKADLSEPEHPDYPVWSETRSGSEAPKSANDIENMTVVDLVSYLESWQPSGDVFGPSREGLADSLTAAVSAGPDRYTAEAERFHDVEPIYVRALLHGLSNAVRQGRGIEWEPVLALARWVVERPREYPEPPSSPSDDRDPGWGSSLSMLTDLIPNGLKEGPAEVPSGLKDEVWAVLRPLTDDPDPSTEDEEGRTDLMAEAVNYAINTVRGRAVEAVIDYALWIHRHLEERQDKRGPAVRGFDLTPKVRTVLDSHLSVGCDPSLAIRSIYGMRFPSLVYLDARWARENVTKIFPVGGEPEPALWRAAWNAYVSYNGPWNNVFEILRAEYASAVERIGEGTGRDRREDAPDEHLGDHIMTMCWRGKLPLEPLDPILERFFEKASDELRANAMAFVGRSLQKTSEVIPSEILTRLKALLGRRLRVARESPAPGDYCKEIAAFGWWFLSGKFDEGGWALDQLTEAIKIAGEMDPDFMVVERMGELATDSPLPTVRCIAMLVERAPHDKLLHSWIDSARAILVAAHESDNPEAQKLAEDTRNRLGERGHLDLRDLW